MRHEKSHGKRIVHASAPRRCADSGGTRAGARAGESGEAEALIRQGVELRGQGKDERALPLFEKAYQMSRSPRTAGQLGLVEMALGYFVDAENYLGEAVASPDHPWVAKNLATLKAQLATAKTQIGELYIVGEPAGAEVLVNGKPVGRLPLSAPIRLDKGRADVQVRAPGYVASTDSVVMVGGKREDRSYRLQREAVAVAPPPPGRRAARAQAGRGEAGGAAGRAATPPPAPAPDRPHRIRRRRRSPRRPRRRRRPRRPLEPAPVAWGVGIAGVAGLVFGAVEGVVAISKRNEFNDHTGPDPANPLQRSRTATRPPTPACQAIQDSHESAQKLSIIGFVAGGALAAGAAVLWVLSSPKERAGAPAPPSPATPDSGRVVLPVGCSSRRSPDAA